MNNQHYYISFAIGWVVGETLGEAIREIVNGFEYELKNMINKNGSAYLWYCLVDAPIDVEYRIEFYKPVDVDIVSSNHLYIYITRFTKDVINYITGDKDYEVVREER